MPYGQSDWKALPRCRGIAVAIARKFDLGGRQPLRISKSVGAQWRADFFFLVGDRVRLVGLEPRTFSKPQCSIPLTYAALANRAKGSR